MGREKGRRGEEGGREGGGRERGKEEGALLFFVCIKLQILNDHLLLAARLEPSLEKRLLEHSVGR